MSDDQSTQLPLRERPGVREILRRLERWGPRKPLLEELEPVFREAAKDVARAFREAFERAQSKSK
jgi:hypothetical protein